MKRKAHTDPRLPRVLALLLALLVLCGCGEAAAPAAPAESEAPPAAEPAVKTPVAPEPDPPAELEARIETEPIEESRHDREPDYMAVFQTHRLSPGPFTLHMENRIYEETALRQAAKALLGDLTALEQAAGAKPEAVTVYLVQSTVEGGPQAVGTQVFTSPEDLASGAYREALAAAAYGLTCPWQQAGLKDYAFGEEPALNLRDYYAEPSHALTASCSILFLSPVLSDEETVLAARATARSLTAYLLKNGGVSALREAEDPAAVLPAWAESLGISPAPSLPEGSAQAAALRLGTRKGYVCALQVKNFTVLLSEDSWVQGPDELYAWFCSFFAGVDMMLEQIGREAPSALALAKERYAESITIILTDPYQVTFTYPSINEIRLAKPDATWHEMIHLLLEERKVRAGQGWQEEALAEHFCYRAQDLYAPTRYYSEGFEAYLQFFEEESGEEPTEDDLRFHRSVWNLYLSFRDPNRTESDDNEAYCRAYGICSLVLQGRLERTQVRRKYDMSVNSKRGLQFGGKEEDGEALSYPESLVLFEYLVGLYGMDPVVDAFLNGATPEEAFGIGYPELYAAARAYYEELYLDQMALD